MLFKWLDFLLYSVVVVVLLFPSWINIFCMFCPRFLTQDGWVDIKCFALKQRITKKKLILHKQVIYSNNKSAMILFRWSHWILEFEMFNSDIYKLENIAKTIKWTKLKTKFTSTRSISKKCEIFLQRNCDCALFTGNQIHRINKATTKRIKSTTKTILTNIN